MQKHLGDTCELTLLDDRALIALQGPRAECVLAELWADIATMRFMDVVEADLHDVPCIISRSGYTGEDGFEISIPAASAEDVTRRILEHPDVMPIGLGARDFAASRGRPVSSMAMISTPRRRRSRLASNGRCRRRAALAAPARAAFRGAGVILRQFADGATRRRVGLKPEGKAPVRGGAPLFADADGKTPIGAVTSGGFGPSADHPVAMGYVDSAHTANGTRVFAEVRGKYLPITVAALPFVTPDLQTLIRS